MFEQLPILVVRVIHPGQRHGCFPVCATGDVIYLLLYLGMKKGAMNYGAQKKSYTNLAPDQHSLYLSGQHAFAIFIKRVMSDRQDTL